MGFILWFVAMLVCPVITLWFIAYPRLITDAHWYGWISERLYLYAFPPFFGLASVVSASKVFEAWGLPWPEWLEKWTIGPLAFLMICGFFATMGVPVPPFLTPKWVRERRKQDREERRRRREMKKTGATEG